MNLIFQTAPLNYQGLLGFMLVFLIFFIIISIAVYIYTSLAFMALARKTKTEPAGIAWIPVIGPSIVASRIAKMHWWPILLLVGFWIPFLNFVLIIIFAVFFFIWRWKTFEAVGKPGWWILLLLIPLAGQIIFLILLGVAAWSKSEEDIMPTKPVKRKR